KAGSVSNLVTGLEDWVPTLVDIIGSRKPLPEGIDGVSIAPTLLGNNQRPRPFLYREFSGYGGQQAVWMGRWKGVRQKILRRNTPTPLKIELFDLESDVSESRDVAAAHPEIVTRIRTLMTREHQPSQAYPIKPLD
ncbi:MAG: arylsulfatase, partial [Planctomycetaceae bacterium]